MENRKIAILIAAHNDPAVLKRLVYALDYEKFDIYIHVDKKSDISSYDFSSYKLKYSALRILENRVKVYWGDISQVYALLNMYEAALGGGDYCRFVTLSGNDYPLRPNEEIYSVLSDPDKEFIMGNVEEEEWKHTDYFFKPLGLFGKVLTRVIRLLHIKRKPLYVDGKKTDIYFAPSWHALSDGCVKYVMSELKAHEEYLKFFRRTFASDEALIPTIVFNSKKYSARALRNSFPKGTHYNEKPAVHYINYDPIVQVFKEEDFDKLVSSGKLFTRKVNSGVSDGLMDKLDEYRGANKEEKRV